MAKVRQDAWSHEDDLLLAETVLRHVREGSTQLKAFEEVGDKLNRTSAACGFRWNAEVRKRYTEAMELAKRQRKERKRALARQKKQTLTNHSLSTNSEAVGSVINESPVTLDTIIQYLKSFKQTYEMNERTNATIEQMVAENKSLQDEVKELTNKLTKTEKQLTTMKEDYQTFIQIMERARKMTVLDDQGTFKSPAFRMDKNGNLEQLTERLN
ncbi:MAG TPA: RsfA family transcriptional regulator [Bacillota bacterium]|nr:RsfA family transcriptional regulator [Bacillota bacterium]